MSESFTRPHTAYPVLPLFQATPALQQLGHPHSHRIAVEKHGAVSIQGGIFKPLSPQLRAITQNASPAASSVSANQKRIQATATGSTVITTHTYKPPELSNLQPTKRVASSTKASASRENVPPPPEPKVRASSSTHQELYSFMATKRKQVTETKRRLEEQERRRSAERKAALLDLTDFRRRQQLIDKNVAAGHLSLESRHVRGVGTLHDRDLLAPLQADESADRKLQALISNETATPLTDFHHAPHANEVSLATSAHKTSAQHTWASSQLLEPQPDRLSTHQHHLSRTSSRSLTHEAPSLQPQIHHNNQSISSHNLQEPRSTDSSHSNLRSVRLVSEKVESIPLSSAVSETPEALLSSPFLSQSNVPTRRSPVTSTSAGPAWDDEHIRDIPLLPSLIHQETAMQWAVKEVLSGKRRLVEHLSTPPATRTKTRLADYFEDFNSDDHEAAPDRERKSSSSSYEPSRSSSLTHNRSEEVEKRSIGTSPFVDRSWSGVTSFSERRNLEPFTVTNSAGKTESSASSSSMLNRFNTNPSSAPPPHQLESLAHDSQNAMRSVHLLENAKRRELQYHLQQSPNEIQRREIQSVKQADRSQSFLPDRRHLTSQQTILLREQQELFEAHIHVQNQQHALLTDLVRSSYQAAVTLPNEGGQSQPAPASSERLSSLKAGISRESMRQVIEERERSGDATVANKELEATRLVESQQRQHLLRTQYRKQLDELARLPFVARTTDTRDSEHVIARAQVTDPNNMESVRSPLDPSSYSVLDIHELHTESSVTAPLQVQAADAVTNSAAHLLNFDAFGHQSQSSLSLTNLQSTIDSTLYDRNNHASTSSSEAGSDYTVAVLAGHQSSSFHNNYELIGTQPDHLHTRLEAIDFHQRGEESQWNRNIESRVDHERIEAEEMLVNQQKDDAAAANATLFSEQRPMEPKNSMTSALTTSITQDQASSIPRDTVTLSGPARELENPNILAVEDENVQSLPSAIPTRENLDPIYTRSHTFSDKMPDRLNTAKLHVTTHQRAQSDSGSGTSGPIDQMASQDLRSPRSPIGSIAVPLQSSANNTSSSHSNGNSITVTVDAHTMGSEVSSGLFDKAHSLHSESAVVQRPPDVAGDAPLSQSIMMELITSPDFHSSYKFLFPEISPSTPAINETKTSSPSSVDDTARNTATLSEATGATKLISEQRGDVMASQSLPANSQSRVDMMTNEIMDDLLVEALRYKQAPPPYDHSRALPIEVFTPKTVEKELALPRVDMSDTLVESYVLVLCTLSERCSPPRLITSMWQNFADYFALNAADELVLSFAHLVFDTVSEILVNECPAPSVQSVKGVPWMLPDRDFARPYRRTPTGHALFALVHKKLRQCCPIAPGFGDDLDKLLTRGILAEDAEWIDYDSAELQAKLAVADDILSTVLAEVLDNHDDAATLSDDLSSH